MLAAPRTWSAHGSAQTFSGCPKNRPIARNLPGTLTLPLVGGFGSWIVARLRCGQSGRILCPNNPTINRIMEMPCGGDSLPRNAYVLGVQVGTCPTVNQLSANRETSRFAEGNARRNILTFRGNCLQSSRSLLDSNLCRLSWSPGTGRALNGYPKDTGLTTAFPAQKHNIDQRNVPQPPVRWHG